MASSYLLALNCGSSSLKASLLLYPSLEAVASLSASSIGSEQATLKVKRAGQNDDVSSVKGESHAEIFSDILEKIQGLHLIRGDVQEQIRIVTHRIVHGGTFSEPVVVTKDHTEALAKMEELSAFAPLHNHHAVLTVKAVLEALPKAKNLLCFDTLFHTSIPPHIYTYPIAQPEHDSPVPLRRYGFHGLSYASILGKMAKFLNKPEREMNLIICHLGSGASMCCVKDGKSYDTTMGLTPLEGLPGGTRSGTLDPSLIFHLFPSSSEAGKIKETNGMKIGQGELLLNKESGFKGLCGSNEYGQIEKMAKEQRENGDSEGKELLTVQIFENRIMNYIGSYLIPLQGQPDAIVFSGGIGEKSPTLRSSISSQLSWLGISLDTSANDKAGDKEDEDVVRITSPESKIMACRVLTDEEGTCALLAKKQFGEDP